MIFKIIKKWWQSIRYYVIADPADNSVTLSKALFVHIKNNAKEGEVARVFAFRVADMDTFGFAVNPDIDKPTQMCDIQYNGRYKCIGFETLCPSVCRILYEYGLQDNHRVKMSVSVHKTTQGRIYYQFDRPDVNSIRKSKNG